MNEEMAVFQIQLCVREGQAKIGPAAVRPKCQACGRVLGPDGLPYTDASIITPASGWVAIEPTLCGVTIPPEFDHEMAALERAKIKFREFQYGEMVNALRTDGRRPCIRVAEFQRREIMMQSDDERPSNLRHYHRGEK